MITNSGNMPIGAMLVSKYYADSYADMSYSHPRKYDTLDDAAETSRRRYWKRWIAAGRPHGFSEGYEPTVDLRYVFEDDEGKQYDMLFQRKAISRFGPGAPDLLTEADVAATS